MRYHETGVRDLYLGGGTPLIQFIVCLPFFYAVFFICFSATLQNVSRILSSQWIVNVYVYQHLPIERLSMTFIFPANGKNSTSAVCYLALERGNE